VAAVTPAATPAITTRCPWPRSTGTTMLGAPTAQCFRHSHLSTTNPCPC